MTIWTKKREEAFIREAGVAIRAQMERLSTRSMELPIATVNQREAQWTDLSYYNMSREGYEANPLIFACIVTWILAFREAPIRVVDAEGKSLDDHPATPLLRRPNPYMTWGELNGITILFRMLGGECYLHKVRNEYGEVIELYPYHTGLMRPVSGYDSDGKPQWISHYVYQNGRSKPVIIDPANIITLRWFSPDPEKPWTSYPPIYAIARESDTEIAITRMIKAFVDNDAMPRTAVMLPVPQGNTPPASDAVKKRMKDKWKELFGGDNRGDVVVLQGMDVKRLSLDLKELDLRGVSARSQSHICSVLRTPIEVMGFTAGLDRSTYANKETSRKIWHEDSVSPLWIADGEALTHGLANDFTSYKKFFRFEYDQRNVAAYRESDANRNDRAVARWQSNLCTMNEARELAGLPPRDDGNVFFKDFAPGAVPIAPKAVASPTNKPKDETQPDDQSKEESTDEGALVTNEDNQNE